MVISLQRQGKSGCDFRAVRTYALVQRYQAIDHDAWGHCRRSTKDPVNSDRLTVTASTMMGTTSPITENSAVRRARVKWPTPML
jgi:hypothetical protein